MAKMGRPPSENPKSAELFIRLEPETKTRLEKYGMAIGVSAAEAARMAIMKFLDDTPGGNRREKQDVSEFVGNGRTSDGLNICLLDLNFTLVSNQAETRYLRPFAKRMEHEEYRTDLIEAVRRDYVIIITARPDFLMRQTMENVFKKTGWKPDEVYFNDIDAQPSVFKESALKRFVFPKHGSGTLRIYAVESNPRTRSMYKRCGIEANPYDKFMQSKGKKLVQIVENPEL